MQDKKKIYGLKLLVAGVLLSAGYASCSYEDLSDDDFFEKAAAEIDSGVATKQEEPIIIVQAPITEPKEEQQTTTPTKKPIEIVLFTVDIPGIGLLDLMPFKDTSRRPAKSGFRLVFADSKTNKLSLGAMDIDEGQIEFVDGALGITGQATLFGNKARFGIKDIDFVLATRFVKRIVFGVDFINKPSFEIIPGVAGSRVDLTNVELEIERGKPMALRAVQTVFGQSTVIQFAAESDHVDASLALVDTPLSSLITSVTGTPLEKAIVKNAGLTLKNIYAKSRAENTFTVDMSGTVDLTPTQLSDDPAQVSNLAFSAAVNSQSVSASIRAQKFPMADIGTINSAQITIKAGSALANLEKEKASITLAGDLSFVVDTTGTLDIAVASKISNKGVEFAGSLKKPLEYAGVSMREGLVSFDTVQRVVDIKGDISFQGLDLAATFALQPDADSPGDKNRRTIAFSAKAKSTEFKPFASTGIPVINSFAFTNLDAGIELVKKSGQATSKAIKLDGDVNILNVSLRSIIKFVVNNAGQKGVYIDAPLPKNWTFSQSIPELRGPIFDGLVFQEASFVACSIEYEDPEKNVTVNKGLQFYAKVPLAGTLKPVADLLGSSGQALTMFGNITANPRTMAFGIKVGGGNALSSSTVSIGDTEIVLTGAPSLGLKANVIVRPSDKDKLVFAGMFKLEPTEAAMDVSMNGKWQNPFGINGLSLSDVALVLAYTYGAPLPTKFGVAAKLGISATNTIECAVVADAAFKNMALKGKADKISFMELITGFARPMGVNIPDPNIPIMDLRDVDLRFAATDTPIGKEIIEQGVTMKGKLDLLGQEKAAELNVNVDTSGIKIYGYTQPINFKGLLKVSGLSGQASPCKIRIEGGSGQDRPEVDIELTLARQNFLVQGAMVLGDESSGVFYKTASCLNFSRSGIGFEFLSQIGSNKLLYSRVQGKSSGSFSSPQFELSIDFEQHLQQFIKDQVNAGFDLAKRELVNGINTAQQEINKISAVKADASEKIKDAEKQVAQARASLAAINSAMQDANKAFADAQRDVDSIGNEIRSLNAWYNNLPKY